MENEEKLMSGEESLRIISEMINKTKVNIRQGIFHLLFWGWLIFVCSLTEYLLSSFTGFTKPWLVWLLVIPGVFVSFIFGYVKGKKARVHTYADMLYLWTWMAFLFSSIVIFIIIWEDPRSFPPFILTLAAIPTFLSGFIIKFRPLIIGGITFWIFALAAYFGGHEIAPLVVAAAVLTGYIIPGYLLKSKVDHDTL